MNHTTTDINELRNTYISRIIQQLPKINYKCFASHSVIEDLLIKIDKCNSLEPTIWKDFYNKNEYYDALYNGDTLAIEYSKKADVLLKNTMFYGDLEHYNYLNLPFIVTRSISNIENDLYERYVELLINEQYISKLKPRFKYLKQQANIYGIITDDLPPPTQSKEEIISNIKKFIDSVEKYRNKPNRTKMVRKLFRYLARPELIRFINLPENIKFKKSIQNKLFQFRDLDDLREANVWWRNIFKQRMPISKSS